MSINYGKAAYERTEDILTRLRKLEKASAEPDPYKTVFFGGGYLFVKNKYAERSCYFYATGENDIDCEFRFSFPSGLTGYVYFYLNGDFVCSRYYTGDEAIAEFSTTCKKGVNALRAEITLQGYAVEPSPPYEVGFAADVSGVIDNRLIDDSLKIIDDGIFGVKTDDVFSVVDLRGATERGLFSLFDAQEADMKAYNGGYVAVKRGFDKQCKMLFYDGSFELTDEIPLGASYKKMAVRIYGTPVVYALKGNSLVELNIAGTTVTERDLGIKGTDVAYFNAYNAEYIVVTDFLGNAFVHRIRRNAATNIRRTFAVGKRSDLFIPYSGDFRLYYREGSKIYSQTVSDYCVYGDKVFLADGKAAATAGNVTAALGQDGKLTKL